MTPFLLFGVILAAFLVSVEASLRGRPLVVQVEKMIDAVGAVEDEDSDLEKEALGDMLVCKAKAMSMIEEIRSGSGENDASIKARACKSMRIFHTEEEIDNMEDMCMGMTSVALMAFAHGQESDLVSCEDAVEVGLMSVREIRNETDVSRAVLSKWEDFHAQMDFYMTFWNKLIGGLNFHRSEL